MSDFARCQNTTWQRDVSSCQVSTEGMTTKCQFLPGVIRWHGSEMSVFARCQQMTRCQCLPGANRWRDVSFCQVPTDDEMSVFARYQLMTWQQDVSAQSYYTYIHTKTNLCLFLSFSVEVNLSSFFLLLL